MTRNRHLELLSRKLTKVAAQGIFESLVHGTESQEAPALEGLLPSGTDHKIDNYLRKMRLLAGL